MLFSSQNVLRKGQEPTRRWVRAFRGCHHLFGKADRQTLRWFTSSDSRILVIPAHISNRLNDKIRLIALDEVSTFFREPKLPML